MGNSPYVFAWFVIVQPLSMQVNFRFLYENFDYTSINMDPKTFCQRHLSLHLCVGGYYCVNSFASPSLLLLPVCVVDNNPHQSTNWYLSSSLLKN